MLPTAFILCSLTSSPTPIDLPPELLEQSKGYFDDSMHHYVPVVIGRLEDQLARAKKNGRPRAEIEDIEKALEAWRKGGSLPSRVSPEPAPAKPTANQTLPPARPDSEAIATLQLLIEQAKARGESQSTLVYYQKLLDELLAKQPKR